MEKQLEEERSKPKRWVVCAANKYDDYIVCGARHFDSIMHGVLHAMDNRPHSSTAEQGFIDQFGVWMNRVEALQVAKDSGQPLNMERNGCPQNRKLYSEGLY